MKVIYFFEELMKFQGLVTNIDNNCTNLNEKRLYNIEI